MQLKPPAQARSVVFYFVRLFMTGALLAGACAAAGAEQVVYEHYYYQNTTDNVNGATWKAQTFVAVSTHPVRVIRLKLQKEGNPPGDMTVHLRATDAAGKPTGGDLASASIACASFNTLNLWYDFDLGTDYTLSAGTTYAFVLSVPGADATNRIWNCVVIDPTHDYTGGQMWASYNSGSIWGALPTWDTAFKIVGPGTPSATPAADPKITGYLHEINVRKDPAILDRIDFAKLDYVFYVGLHATSDTDPTLTTGFDMTELVDHIDTCVTKGHAAGVKVMLVLFCGNSSTYLQSIVASDPLRAQLIENLADFVAAHNLDGVDIDWEAGQSRAEMDTLLNDVAVAMHVKGKLVSFAGSCYKPDCSLATFSNVDLVNIMTYDMAHNKHRPVHALYEDATAVVSMWADDGYDRRKLYMGIPFYGRDMSGFFDYKTIVDELNPPPEQDYATVTDLAGTAVDGGLVWWNGIDLAKRKVDWAVDNGIAGLMVYELAEDILQDPRSLLQQIYDEKVSRAAYDVPPAVTTVAPQGNDAPVDSVMTVSFSKTMDHASAEAAFSISPSTAGSFSWQGDTLRFHPSAALLFNTTFTVKVSTAAKDGSGRALSSVAVWQFTTVQAAAPQVTSAREKVYPNPYIRGKNGAGSKVTIANLPGPSTIRIYNITGDLVSTLPHRQSAAGGSEEWDVSGIASGIYFYVVSGDGIAARKGKIAIVK